MVDDAHAVGLIKLNLMQVRMQFQGVFPHFLRVYGRMRESARR